MFVAEYITAFIKARKESKDKITRVISAWSVREETIHEEGFQDGATFGYNKAKEEIQEQGLALQSDMDKTIEQNIQLKKQIEKLEKLVPKTCDNCVGYGCHAICVDCDFKDKWEIK